MAKQRVTEQEPAVETAAVPSPTFTVVGFEVSDEMFVAVEDRQVNLANPTPELTAWLYERREKLSGLLWSEQ